MKMIKWGLCMGIALATTNVAWGAADGIRIEIQGSPGTGFMADWELFPSAGGEKSKGYWEGQVPQVYELPPGRLDVILIQTSSEGNLDVMVKTVSNVSRSSTQGEGSRIRLSVQ